LAEEERRLEVTYTLTPEDLWAFTRFQAGRKPLSRFFNVFGMVVLLLAWPLSLWTNVRRLLFWRHLLGSVPLAWHYFWAYNQRSLLLFLLYTVSIVYLVWGLRFFFLRRQRSLQRERKPVTMRLYRDVIVVTAPAQNARLSWGEIREIVGSRDYLYFYTAPATALIVPKRAFADGAAAAFEAAARAFKNDSFKDDPQAASAAADTPEVWPPPPVGPSAPTAPAMEEVPDPPGTVEIAYVTRRADAWRSACHTLLTRPGLILRAAVPLLVSAFFIAFSLRADLTGYLLALLGASLLALLLIVNQTRIQFAARYPHPDSTRACVSKIRPDAYVDISPNGRSVVPWRNIRGVRLFRGDLYVRRKGGQGVFFIPRSAFPTPADARTALEAMRRCRQQAPTVAADGTQNTPATL
jgi:hypothetical protein